MTGYFIRFKLAHPDGLSAYPCRMTTAPLRKDAARNWQRIVEVGRELADDGVPLQLNDVARVAGVGVATVYRHFPTPEALLETVATPGLEALAAHGERALTDPDPWQALAGFLFAAIDAMLTDASIPPVTAAPDNALPRTTELKARLQTLGGQLLARARAAGTVRHDMTQADLIPLMCGVAYAAKAHASGHEPAPATARRYLAMMLDGLRASPSAGTAGHDR
jgi:AcrR family transcriptional regulator